MFAKKLMAWFFFKQTILTIFDNLKIAFIKNRSNFLKTVFTKFLGK